MRRRYPKVLITGAFLTSTSLLAAWAVGRDVPVLYEPAPMDAVLEATETNAAVSWDLPVTYNEHVEDWIDFLKGRNRDKTQLWLERSGRYTPMIRAELRERGMPEDLIYLAFIESGFSPKAHSHAAAVGLWQFIAETGRRYGLDVDSHVDERRDPVKSTGAALEYLQDLYDRFGSWYLAAAAYNTGENRVGRIMRETTGSERGTDADFWRIANRLPRETRNYVPLMLAAGHIGKEPAKYGFDEIDYHEPLNFATVEVPGSVPLAAVAKAAGTTEDSISGLNPELVRSITPPNKKWNVRVPAGSELQFAVNFEAALREVKATPKAEPKLAGIAHRVKRGETLSGIAKRHGISVRALQNANSGLIASRLQIGQTIRVPRASATTRVATAKTKTAAKNAKASRFHRVRRGENLSVIAARYDLSVSSLKRLNALRGSTIRAGQRLRVS